MIIEYAVFNNEETTLPCNWFGGQSCNVGIGQYAQASEITIRVSFYYLLKC